MSTFEARRKFKETFPRKISVLGVVHSKDLAQTIKNTQIAIENGLHGVFLINHGDLISLEFWQIIEATRKKFEDIWIGVNFLRQDEIGNIETVGMLENRGVKIDGIWTDNPEIIGINPGYNNQELIHQAKRNIGWEGTYFGGVLFKGQTQVHDEKFACEQGAKYLDVITTSGPGTGISAEMGKIEKIRKYSGEHPVGLASGVDASNIEDYSKLVDICLVASSISKNFHNFDQAKVRELGDVVERING